LPIDWNRSTAKCIYEEHGIKANTYQVHVKSDDEADVRDSDGESVVPRWPLDKYPDQLAVHDSMFSFFFLFSFLSRFCNSIGLHFRFARRLSAVVVSLYVLLILGMYTLLLLGSHTLALWTSSCYCLSRHHTLGDNTGSTQARMVVLFHLRRFQGYRRQEDAA
jgi:hypothetical protein